MKIDEIDPGLFYVEGAATPDECEILQAEARPHLRADWRTTHAIGRLGCKQPEMSPNAAIVARMAEHLVALRGGNDEGWLTGLGDLKSEPVEFVRYEAGFPGYPAHCDLPWREWTFLLYLNTPGGGQTEFPERDITVTPTTGDGLLWQNSLPMGKQLEINKHAVRAVTGPEKWVAVFWFARQYEQAAKSGMEPQWWKEAKEKTLK